MDQHQQTNGTRSVQNGSHKSVSATCSSCHCVYDFAVVHGDRNKALSEYFFEVLEQRFGLKGYHNKRDQVVGVLKQRQLVSAWQKSSFVFELLSTHALKSKAFQRCRSIAHEVESKSKKGGAAHPEVLTIFLDIPRQEQRNYSTTVGRSYEDTDLFWTELVSYMQGAERRSNINSHSESQYQEHLSEDSILNNNNNPEEKSTPVKCRKKHKVFNGLFSGKRKVTFKRVPNLTKKAKRGSNCKRKSKQKLKSFRKLLICMPTGTSSGDCGSTGCSEPPSIGQTVDSGQTGTARNEEQHCMQHAFKMEMNQLES